MSASLDTLACRRFVSLDITSSNSTCILSHMIVRDESEAEINEALKHLVDGIRHAGDFRKQHLLDLVDGLLDAKLEMKQ